MTTPERPAARSTPVHAAMDQFEVRDGQLWVGGQPLTRLAERVGRTPFYAYDRGLLRRVWRELRAGPAATR